jgi:hypothetical protein
MFSEKLSPVVSSHDKKKPQNDSPRAEEYYKNNNSSSMAGTSCNANNIQWNIWQQFQWPNQPEQNRWSKFFPVPCVWLEAGVFLWKCQFRVCDRIFVLFSLQSRFPLFFCFIPRERASLVEFSIAFSFQISFFFELIFFHRRPPRSCF